MRNIQVLLLLDIFTNIFFNEIKLSNLHGEDGEYHDVVSDLSLQVDHSVVVGVVPGHR